MSFTNRTGVICSSTSWSPCAMTLHKHLLVVRPDRKDRQRRRRSADSAAASRQCRCAGGDQDAIERLRVPASRACRRRSGSGRCERSNPSAAPTLHRAAASRARSCRPRARACKNRGLVAAAGADLQHAVSRPHVERCVISATMYGCEIVCPYPIGAARSAKASSAIPEGRICLLVQSASRTAPVRRECRGRSPAPESSALAAKASRLASWLVHSRI